jgi:tRNA(adenine34) deaminase
VESVADLSSFAAADQQREQKFPLLTAQGGALLLLVPFGRVKCHTHSPCGFTPARRLPAIGDCQLPLHDPASDEIWMEEALRYAQRALEAAEVPVGAIVVFQGRIVGRGANRNIADNDPTAHAEIVALREAGKNLGNHRLIDCELFATIEPCAMCAGALIHARISRLVYGADDSKAGAVHSALSVVNYPGANHQMEVRGGVLAGRSADIMQEFFRSRR